MMRDSLPLDDLLGRVVRYRGQDWTVAIGYDGRPCLQQALAPEAFDMLVAAIREGAVTMTSDGSEYRAAPVPGTREGIECEVRLHQAMLEGHRQKGTLADHQVAALEHRLALLRAALADIEAENAP